MVDAETGSPTWKFTQYVPLFCAPAIEHILC